MQLLNNIARALVPVTLKKTIWELYISVMIRLMPLKYQKLIKEVRRKDKIRVVFMIQLASSWKYDYLFNLLLNDPRFEPVIYICPLINYDQETLFKEIRTAVDFFKKMNYPVISSWDEKDQKWMDVKDVCRPDLVFFSNPWEELSRKEHYIYNFLDTLTCYAPYGFKSSHLYQAIFNKPFQNLLWTIFYETQIHKQLASKYARNKGANGLVTGYPGMDNMINPAYQPSDVWKIKDRKIKRIIWAPHHTIFGKDDSNVGFSTFLLYCNYMIDVAIQYKDSVQISFKPHPLLRPKMYKHKDWGKKMTDAYFDRWSTMENTQLNEGNYIDLFLTSDALINDGESFMVEYLYTRKPAMFLVADERVTDRFNEFGKMTFDHLYKGYNQNDITDFIQNIIKGIDIKGDGRIAFFENYVKPPHNKLASENIYHYLKQTFVK